jgi:hypothetical protein
MRIVIHLDEDDPVPCVCRVGPLVTAFVGADVVVDPKHRGVNLIRALRAARIDVRELKEGEHDSISGMV